MQVLCARGTLPVFPAGTYKAAYDSAAGTCSGTGDGGVADGGVQEDAGVEGDGGVQDDAGTTAQEDAAAAPDDSGTTTGVPVSGDLASLDPAFLCSGILGPSTSSARIATLQNGVTYYVAVVAVDKSGNASEIVSMESGTPQEVLDFWEDYKLAGGKATGCSLGQRVPAGWIGVGLAVLAVALTLGAARRRRGPRGPGGGAR
jgi:hypothetical protein